MPRPRHNAPPDFDVTGDPGDIETSAVSPRSPAQDEAPSPRPHEHLHPGRDRRSAREVIERHLWQGRHGTVDDDLAENYDPDVIILTRWGTRRGHDGMRELAAKLRDELPDAQFSYDEVLVERDVGFLEWKGTGSDGSRVCDGADSYVVRDGLIVAQTIHYIVHPPPDA